jgi:hypothetical protein
MLWLPDYEVADPPPPGPADVQRMAIDAVRDGLPVPTVAHLFGLDPERLQLAVDAAPPGAAYRRRPAGSPHCKDM